jgi:DNA-binding transcriptional LysR family regulator
LIEELPGPSSGECLAVDRLVWVGAKGGTVHQMSPVPVSLVVETCVFRRPVLDTLRKHDIPWRTVFENGSIDATIATVRSDLAIGAFLESTVPADLDILPTQSGLPELPSFAINLHVSKGQDSPAVLELAQQIRENLIPVRAPVRLTGTGS